jgi:cell division protein FtsI/penicillin-binding protein 2
MAEKANKILNVILLIMVVIVIKAWHLGVVQYDVWHERAQRPQHRVIIERAERGSICDRFSLPLAINKVQYNAAIIYSHIRTIPSVAWRRGGDGIRRKYYKRREYIEELAAFLGKELNMDDGYVEDLIHSKAALFPNIPYVIQEDIDERTFSRLKMLEKDWMGIYAERVPRRFYPHEKVASDVIGYMGAINREEYLSVAHEKAVLGKYAAAVLQGDAPLLPTGHDDTASAFLRLEELKRKSYSINDRVGKMGVEEAYDEELRGFYGKRMCVSDARGNFLKELPGARPPLPGRRVQLALSLELQEYAEKLLAQAEEVREGKSVSYDVSTRKAVPLHQPWLMGGAVVAIEPMTGEVLALASYPRFNPNDFVPTKNKEKRQHKQRNIRRWFETDSHVADIWNGRALMERERYDVVRDVTYKEKRMMTWKNYINFILPEENEARKALKEKIITVGDALVIQRAVEELCAIGEFNDVYALFNMIYKGGGHRSYHDEMPSHEKERVLFLFNQYRGRIDTIKSALNIYFEGVEDNYNKVLIVDVCRVAVDGGAFSDGMEAVCGGMDIATYRKVSMAMVGVRQAAKKMAKKLFREVDFLFWREKNQKAFLKEKRREENRAKRYHKPYLDLLEKKERELFDVLWGKLQKTILEVFLTGRRGEEGHKELGHYINHFATWERELEQGAHSKISWYEDYKVVKGAATTVPETELRGYLSSLREYKDLGRPLYGRYRGIRRGEGGKSLEKHLAAAFYPQYGFGYGRSQAFRQAAPQGSIFKLVVAYEALAQRYKELKEKQKTLETMNPLEIVDEVRKVSKGRGKYSWIVGHTSEGEPLTRMYKGGRLPRSDRHNIGKINIVRALEVSSNPYFSLLAGEVLEDPEDLNRAAHDFSFGEKTGIDIRGEISGKLPDDIRTNKTGLYSYAMGQHTLVVTPLQTAIMLSSLANGGAVFTPKVVANTVGREVIADTKGGVSSRLTTKYIPMELKRTLFLPYFVRSLLFEGMHRVVNGKAGSARPGNIHIYHNYPHMMDDYSKIRKCMIGKTGTAEIVETVNLDKESGSALHKHVWFGGISFEDNIAKAMLSGEMPFAKPELVVVVYLRFGNYGKDAAPIVGQIVTKWRELKKKYGHTKEKEGGVQG